ncbi:hypothetical protein PG995_012718 [Apiospora arundinis]
MDAPRDTANVGLKEIFGVPYLISDPKYQEAFQDRMKRGASILGGAPEPHSPSLYSTAGDGRLRLGLPSSKQSGSSQQQQQQQQPPQPQIPTDLQEGEYDFGYAAPATRQWQRFDTPLAGPGDRSLDQSPPARQQRLAQNHLPRFLFRGYSQRSGGGNPHLNQWDKIIPHAFMNTDYASCVPHFDVRNYPRRDEVIEAHLTGTTTDEVLRQTPFSSWSQSPQVALRYSGGPDDGPARLAILDTTRLRPWNEIYNVAEMRYMGYHSLPLKYGCWEYFVYGPIDGDCLYTFPRQDFTDLFRPDLGLGPGLLHRNPSPAEVGRPLGPEAVRYARQIASLFVKKAGWAEERSSIIIYVVVLLVASWRHSHFNPPSDAQLARSAWDRRDLEVICQELLPELSESRNVKLVSDDPVRVSMGYKWFLDALILMKNLNC